MPDHEAPNCSICERPFGTAEELVSGGSPLPSTSPSNAIINSPAKGNTNIVEVQQSPAKMHSTSHSPVRDRRRHHCRGCGQAVCDECSQNRRPVPERGWTTDVRVCDSCNKKTKSE